MVTPSEWLAKSPLETPYRNTACGQSFAQTVKEVRIALNSKPAAKPAGEDAEGNRIAERKHLFNNAEQSARSTNILA